MESNQHKHNALQFLNLIIAGQIDEAYERYVDMQGKHHNLYFSAGMVNLREAMKENERQCPNKQFTVKHALAEGDLVSVHSHLTMKADGPNLSVVHLFRFKGNKIVEFWDCGQVIPADCPNKDGAF